LEAITWGMTVEAFPLGSIHPAQVRYIKLGAGNTWVDSSFEQNRLEFGSLDAPHELIMSGDGPALRAFYEAQGKDKGTVTRLVNMVRDFYDLDEKCLWVTFARGLVWWAFAEPEVIDLGGDGSAHAQRARSVIGCWRCTNIKGHPLEISKLSSLLTSTAATRGTICKLKGADYLLRRINCIEAPDVGAARAASEALVAAVGRMLPALHWSDVEVLTDLLFARQGWQRISEVGGSQKDVDLIVEQPATGERAFVQVKSGADQQTLDRYTEIFEGDGGFDRFFFICTNPVSPLTLPKNKRLHLWAGEPLARRVVGAGLADWVMERST